MIRLNNLKILALIVVLTDAFSAIHAASYHRSIKTPIEYIVEQDIDAKGIGIGEGDFIQKTFDDENGNKKSLFSFGFAGSTGTALYVLLKNGEQRAALTHYRPMRTSDHLAKIHELAGRLKQDISCDEIAKAVGIIFHEEDWAKNPETGPGGVTGNAGTGAEGCHRSPLRGIQGLGIARVTFEERPHGGHH